MVYELPSKAPDMKRVPLKAEPHGFGGTVPRGFPLMAPAPKNVTTVSPTSLSYVMRQSNLLDDDTEAARQGKVDYKPARKVYENMQREGQ